MVCIKVQIETDLIDPHAYLEIETKYKELITLIKNCGGYISYNQLYKHYGGRKEGYKEIENLLTFNLVGKGRLDANRYLYLKNASLKYLKYANLDILPARCPVKSIASQPKNSILVTGLCKMEYFQDRKILLGKKYSKAVFNQMVEKIRILLKTERIKNLYLVKNEKSAHVQSILDCLNQSNFYLTDFCNKDNLLKVTIFDEGINEKFVYYAVKKISRWLSMFGTRNKNNFFAFNLEIATFSEKRKVVLEQYVTDMLRKINTTSIKRSKNKESVAVSGLKKVEFTVLRI